jgi:hypothetical protein
MLATSRLNISQNDFVNDREFQCGIIPLYHLPSQDLTNNQSTPPNPLHHQKQPKSTSPSPSSTHIHISPKPNIHYPLPSPLISAINSPFHNLKPHSFESPFFSPCREISLELASPRHGFHWGGKERSGSVSDGSSVHKGRGRRGIAGYGEEFYFNFWTNVWGDRYKWCTKTLIY